MNKGKYHVLIFGAGKIGSFLGGAILSSEDTEVTFLGRGEHVNKVKNDGLEINYRNEKTIQVHPTVIKNLEDLDKKPDLIILTVRAYQTEEALEQIVNKGFISIPIISFQNGNIIPTILKKISENYILGGTTIITAKITSPGIIFSANSQFPVIIGELDGKRTSRIEKIQSIFEKGGLKCYISENITGEIWGKLIINSNSNTLTGATNSTIAEVFKNKKSRNYSYWLVREGFEIADFENVNLQNIHSGLVKQLKEAINSKDSYNEFAKTQFEKKFKLSMTSLIDEKIKTEVDFTNGYIVDVAKKYGKSAPHHEAIVEMIHKIEQESIDQSIDNLPEL